MTATYADFLAQKGGRLIDHGIDVPPDAIHPFLHEWQSRIVRWAAKKGRAALWADTGLGKTVMQIEWARLVGERVLIVAPLAVTRQTVREAAKVGVAAAYARNDAEADGPGMWVTNFERIDAFGPAGFDAVVLDESSILKDFTAKTRDTLIEWAKPIPYRLACTATPAPNDVVELANHAEFVGVSSRREMLATYFVHDQDGYRVKGHARAPMFRWMASWALAVRSPADLGAEDNDYDLPPLNLIPHLLDVDEQPDGQLFATDLGGVGGRAKIRRQTMSARVARVADLVAAEPDEPWLIWCGLNAEADLLADSIPGAVNVHGGMSAEDKADMLLGFADGDIRALVTKPSIAAFGLNWQHCARMAFVGLSDSYETYYQAIRRCWRYGQERPVDVHIVLSELEGQIAVNVARKERDAAATTAQLVKAMREANGGIQ